MSIVGKHASRQLLKNRSRPVVFWIFFLIAFPLGALIVGYASGYRFQPTTSSLIQTAALRIITKPKHALVYLNGKVQKERTPYLDDTIVPGYSTVTLEKEGYASWEKKLRFDAGKSQVFANILLFRKSTPRAINAPTALTKRSTWRELSDAERLTLTNQGVTHSENFQIIDGPGVLLADSNHQVAFALPDINEWNKRHEFHGSVLAAQWLNNRLLFATSHELWIYYLDENLPELLQRQADDFVDAAWHPDGYYIIASSEHQIIAEELDDRDERQQWTLATISRAMQLNFSKDGDHLLFTVQDQWYDLELY